MAIDIKRERIITLADAATEVPGKPVHVSTIHRWRKKGCRGVRLEVIMRGGIAYTSTEAIARFFAAVTRAANGEHVPNLVPSREAGIQRAEKELAGLAGI